MKTNFKEYITESKSNLLIYRGNTTYPYNYTVIKGDDLYSVSFRKDKPFLFRYHGKINRDKYNPNGELIKNPSKALIMLSQTKLIPPKMDENFLYEFNEQKDLPDADKLSFVKKLEELTKDAVKSINKKFKVNTVPGKILTVRTDNENDIRITIRISNDKVFFNSKPTSGPEYQFDYEFNSTSPKELSELIVSTIKDDPHGGIIEPKGNKYKYDTEKQSKTVKEEEIEPLETPITKKPRRRKRSIDINVIQDVLEDAYILDDIDLKDTSVEELVRRMLLESRRKSSK